MPTWQGAAAGDERGRAEFATRYLSAVRAYLVARWRGTVLLEVVDDALARLDPTRPGGFRPFLYGVIRNVARHVETRRARNREHPGAAEIDFEVIRSREASQASAFERAIHLVKDGLEAAPWGITQIGVYDHDTKTYHLEWVPGWDPNMGPSRYQLATAKQLMGDYEGALEVLDILPWREEFQVGADWIRHGVLQTLGRPLEALPLLEGIVTDRVAGPAIHYNLAMCLLAAARLEEGREELLAYYESCRWPPGWQYPEDAWLADVDAIVAMAEALPSAASPGDLATTPHERVLLGLLLQAHGRHAEATNAFEAAFSTNPELADAFAPWPRTYPLACIAAQEALLTAYGVGPGARALDTQTRTTCRQQALAWMRRALETLQATAERNPEHGPAWLHRVGIEWPRQPPYALVREPYNLDKLPPAEAKAWRAFWADFDEAAGR